MVKVKVFLTSIPRPLMPPDSTSLEEQVNAFLAPFAAKDILSVSFNLAVTTDSMAGKYGGTTMHAAAIVYNG